ncbi:hypothetical protein A7G45_00345 [Mycolicibacterium llatzerense]|nr:hypothetical protein [Mycolicibacterium llatzerense]
MFRGFAAVALAGLCVVTHAAPANAAPSIDGKAVVCDTFDKYGVNVKSVKWIGDYLIDSKGATPSSAITLMEVAMTAYCPNYSKAFDDLNSQLAKSQHPDNPLFN